MKRYRPRSYDAATTMAQRELLNEDRLRAYLAAEHPELLAVTLEEADLLALLRATFFAPFHAGKYDRITAKDLLDHHKPGCRYNDGRIRYSSASMPTAEVAALGGAEALAVWMGLRAAGEAVPQRAFNGVPAGATCTVDLRQHQAACPCGVHRHRYSAHVTITFAGRTIAREFSLNLPDVVGGPVSS